MSKVQIRVPSHIARMLGFKTAGGLTLEKEIREGTTIDELLSTLVATYPGFRESVFNPDVGLVNEQINVVLNNELLSFAQIAHTKLADNDIIALLPIYSGG